MVNRVLTKLVARLFISIVKGIKRSFIVVVVFLLRIDQLVVLHSISARDLKLDKASEEKLRSISYHLKCKYRDHVRNVKVN
jgi:hypothetical protein